MNNKLASSILRAGRYENAKELVIENGRQGSVIKINNGLDKQSFKLSQAGIDELKAQFKRLFGLDERDLAIGKRSKIKLGKNLISASISAIADKDGEKIRIELLSEKPRTMPISHLGLDNDARKIFREALGQPGLIIVSSPEGEGSSTTAYSLLSSLVGHERSLAAISDFLEIEIDGVNHLSKNKRNFSEQIRKTKRGDYDAILIGDADGQELLEALDLAKEGRLVIAETKANNAKEVMDILKISKLGLKSLPAILISNQRLIKNNCPACAKRYQLKSSELRDIFPNIGKELDQKGIWALLSSGCSKCDYKGYTKYIGAFELAVLDRKAKPPMLRFRPIMVDIFRKLINGVSSAKEAAKVSSKL